MPELLLVDDDTAHRSMLYTLLSRWGYNVSQADDGEQAVELSRNTVFDVVLTDIRMARMDGIRAMRAMLEYNPSTPVLIMTAYASVETAVEALRLGAYDYLTKPLDFTQLQHALRRAVEHTRLSTENRALRRSLENLPLGGLIGKSQAMDTLRGMIATIGPTDATVLICGESGTGKELVAKAIHEASARKNKHFVAVNCAALSESLLESELFGHEKGAFTGAQKKRDGRFMQAHEGTLFLDEIGDLPLSVQASFLRALQEGEVQRLGSDATHRVNVRVVAATNARLAAMVKEGRFREDLFYRLNVIRLDIPALRERVDDIPLLAQAFLQKYALANNKNIKSFSPEAMDTLCRYTWPGNVRELENAIERAVILSRADCIKGTEFPPELCGAPKTSEAPTQSTTFLTLETQEKHTILQALAASGNNKSEAARRLGITRATLHNKIKRYTLE